MRLILILLCLPLLASAQQTKTESFTYPVPNNKQVEMDLKFSNTIKVVQWDRNEVKLDILFTYSDEDFLGRFKKKETTSGGGLMIETSLKKGHYNYNCWSCDDPGEGCNCLDFAFVVYAPKDVKLDLSTISGDIEIPKWEGAIRAKSISGSLDVSLSPKDAKDLSVKSVTGEVYTDLDIRLDEGSTSYSKKMNTSLNGGGFLTKLETVSGDIFIRKESK